MKLKQIYLSASMCLAVMGLASCSQAEEPAPVPFSDDADNIEWVADITLPDDFKTRAAASGTVGSDGLYTFSREINRLWYAVYYNGAYLYDSEQDLAPDAVKKGDGFTVLFKFHKDLDPTKIYIFFWAGNSEDNVTVSDTMDTQAINLNFVNRCVSVNPYYMNGNNKELKEYDSFSGYIQLSPTKNVTNYNMKVTLKRPFAQIHVLSDEFSYPGVSTAFPNGVTVIPGFGSDIANSTNHESNMQLPTTWFFDSSLTMSPAYTQNEYRFTSANYQFTNNLSGSSPERVTFKNRTMDYLGCLYVFAPVQKAQFKYPVASGLSSSLGKLNLAFMKKGEDISKAQYAAVSLPADGIQANNRYVVYNRQNTGDGDGGPGGNDGDGGGFVTASFAFEVVTAPGWDGTTDIQK
ncbi:MAG: hypothetical protein J1E95_01595 [Muribaculaceae bacterium]|nr:hypothetical protein [Muribaculaceae bacterium]